jgi:hypothetical protein
MYKFLHHGFGLSGAYAKLVNESIIKQVGIEQVSISHPFQELLYHLIRQVRMIAFVVVQPAHGLNKRYRLVLYRLYDGDYLLPPLAFKQYIHQQREDPHLQGHPRRRILH